MSCSTLSFLFIFLLACGSAGTTRASSNGLAVNFYAKTCPHVEDIVRNVLAVIFVQDPTSPAALLRLMFHDCQVQGCDASILLDSSKSPSVPPEIRASKSFGVRKRDSINILKSKVEAECPRQVSCADLIILAAREAVALSGGPRIRVPLGRRDSAFALGSAAADASLPSADIGVDGTLRLFAGLGMTTRETVAIMGSHTLGVAHCLNLINRLYKSRGDKTSKVDPRFVVALKVTCPEWITSIENVSVVLNDPSPTIFDNLYYKNSMAGHGILKIDSELPANPQTAPFVQQFAARGEDFFQAFGSAFVKLSYSGVLTGNKGVIRRVCNIAQ